MTLRKNLNKLVMRVENLLLIQTPANAIIFNNDLERIANDLGKDINIVAIQISLVVLMRSSPTQVGSSQGDLSLGTQNAWDENTNIFNWKWVWNRDSGTSNQSLIPLNQTLGNFKDILFTIPKFSSEVSGNNASVGQLFLNHRYQPHDAIGIPLTLNAYITLYYI